MASGPNQNTQELAQQRLSDAAAGKARPLMGIGVAALIVALVLGFATGNLSRFTHAYLIGLVFVLSLALGAMAFLLLTYLFRGGWHVLFRRVPEAMVANVPLLAAMALPILIFAIAERHVEGTLLYSWANENVQYPYQAPDNPYYAEKAARAASAATPAAEDAAEAGQAQLVLAADESAELTTGYVAEDSMMVGKRPWLNVPFFGVRLIFYFLVWFFIARYLRDCSLKQDQSGDVQYTRKCEIFSAPATLLFALTATFASFDLIMTLDWTWYSTVYGVYYFSGAMIATVSLIIISLHLLQKAGLLPQVSTEHYHDLGKLLFAFVFFWGYIAFSQYMLIWYASIPGELPWMAHRGLNMQDSADAAPYRWVSLLLLLGHFVIPFAGLLSRHVKRNHSVLVFWAGWLLVMHAVDMYWLIMPEHTHLAVIPGVVPGVIDLLCIVGAMLLFVGGMIYWLAASPLIPHRDPRLHESLVFHNI